MIRTWALLVGRGAIYRARGIGNGMDCKMARLGAMNGGRDELGAP